MLNVFLIASELDLTSLVLDYGNKFIEIKLKNAATEEVTDRRD